MSITERQKQILNLLNENTFLTVEKLSQMTYTSPSSIRRDLTKLQEMYFIKRTHGGAKILNEDKYPAPFTNRVTQNTSAKRIIAKKAASLLTDGQTIMLDGSSTAGYLIPHISKLKDVTVFTNNLITAVNAINYGIKTYSIGGCSVNNSVIVSGTQSYKTVSQLHPEILFFSSHSIDKNGVISDPTEEENYLRSIMIENSQKSVFLCDSGKFNRKSLYTLVSLNEIDAAIFDTAYPGLKTTCALI